jgi:hypothetical protein
MEPVSLGHKESETPTGSDAPSHERAAHPTEPAIMMIRSRIEYDLSLARTKSNEPISDDAKDQIRALIAAPSAELWDRCRLFVLAIPKNDKPITLWRAITAIDPSFQKVAGPRDARGVTTWDRLPTPKMIEDAIAWATH